MPFQLPLPHPLTLEGWKVRIHDAENPYEEPHVTIYKKTRKWRLSLRSGLFLDRGDSWNDIHDAVREAIQDSTNWSLLQREWSNRHGSKNPVQLEEENHER